MSAAKATLKTSGRPQEIVAQAVREGATIDPLFLSWLWEDFQTLLQERDKDPHPELTRAILAWARSQPAALVEQTFRCDGCQQAKPISEHHKDGARYLCDQCYREAGHK